MIAWLGLSLAADDPLEVSPLVATLDNGLRVIIEKQDRTDLVAVHLHVGVGSADERDGERGMAHLFEHLMYEGSTHAPGNAYDELLTAAGGENNAFTSEDETVYHAVFPSGALERVLFLESDRLAYLDDALTQEALANQKNVVLEERAQAYGSANGRDTDALTRLLFREGHPYHVPVIGTVDEVQAFDLDSVRGFHQRWYRPSQSVLAIVGNVEPGPTLERVKHWFSDVPGGPEQPRGQLLDRRWLSDDVFGVVQDNVDDCTLHMAWAAPNKGSEDEAAMLVASTILSDGRGTRFDRHYYRKGWVSDAEVKFWASESDGMFIATVATSRGQLRGAQRLIKRELGRMIKQPPTDAEMARARSRIRTFAIGALEGPQSRAETLVDCLRLQGSPDCIADEWAQVEAISSEAVALALSRVLSRPAVHLSVVPVYDPECALPGSSPVELP